MVSRTNPTLNISPGEDSAGAVLASAGTLTEMFCSVQGEGIFLGERQIFLRLAGCSLSCNWCDTVYSKVRVPRFTIHDGRDKIQFPNPVSLEQLIGEVLAMADRNSPVATVSITGGEPLEQPEFTVAVARRLRSDGFRVYLETAGLHPEGLKMASPWVDVIAMDIKLPSSGMGVVWQEHKLALDLLRGTDFDPQTRGDRRTLFVKVVVDGNGRVDEIEEAARLVGRLGRSIPLVLQPENDTLTSHRRPRADASRLFEVIESGQRAALVHLDDVRVIPQCHKIMKVR